MTYPPDFDFDDDPADGSLDPAVAFLDGVDEDERLDKLIADNDYLDDVLDRADS